MLFPLERFREAYNKIKLDALGGTCSVLIYVAQDVDALAACCILTSLLKADFIMYRLITVGGYNDIELSAEDEFKSVVMLNCGGNVSLEEIFEDKTDGRTFYVLDSHKPFNLDNIYANDKIILFDDGDNLSILPAFEDVYGSDGEGIDSDDENSEDEDEEFAAARRRRLQGETDEPMPITKYARRRERRKKVADYYVGSYYGTSAAIQAYYLAMELSKDSNELLWHAIVGLTDQYVHDRIDNAKYSLDVRNLQNEVLRLKGSDDDDDDEFSNYDEAIDERLPADRMVIRFSEEPRFLLHRHWTLYDSMYHSSYVGTRMSVWKSRGKSQLQTFLAYMGLPLHSCKQKFSSVDMEFKKTLKNQMDVFSPKYSLGDIRYGSFTMKHCFQQEISASDVVYVATALLESPTSPQTRFHRALDSMRNPKFESTSMFSCGLDASKQFYQALMRQVTVIMETNAIVTGPFRYVCLSDSAEMRHFLHPLSLAKLGMYLIEAIRAMKKPSKNLVLAVHNVEEDCYSVLGMTPGEELGEVRKNKFGVEFRAAAEKTNSSIKHHGFDPSFLEIKTEDLVRFVEELHASML